MTVIRFIGDVHGGLSGHMERYEALTQDCERSVQVGDFGAGFTNLPLLGPEHRFIRGNHDNPAICASHPNWIKDGTYEDDIFYAGGAFSVDREQRIIGRDIWADEEISYEDFWAIMDYYEQCKPRIVITHDAPARVNSVLFPHSSRRNTRTSTALENMFEIHRPETWIFGHWHTSIDTEIGGTRFRCLDELEGYDLNIEPRSVHIGKH